MNSDSDSEGEGFYKPVIQISDAVSPVHTEAVQIDES